MSKDVQVKITADSSNAQKEIKATANSIDDVGKSAKSSESKLKAITDALKSIASNTGGTNAQLANLGAQLKALNNSVNGLSSNLGKMAKSANSAGKAVQDMGNKAKSADGGIKSAKTSMDAFVATQLGQYLLHLAGSFAELGGSAIMAAAQMRQYEIAFQTMLKSADAGTQMLKDLQQFAANTPFDVPGVVQAGQQLMAFGFQAKEIIPMLTSLGDAAAGLGKGTAGVSQLAYALGQMQTSGKLNAQDMMQLTNAGIAAWDMLAKAAGKSVAEMKDLTSKGMVDSKEAVKILVAGINEQFGGMMDKTSEEVTGLMANIEETAGNTKAVVGKYLIQAFDIKDKLKDVSEELGEFQQKMQEATDRGDSFSKVIQNCIPPGVTIAFTTLASVIGTTLVFAIKAATLALGEMLGLGAVALGWAAAIGVAVGIVLANLDDFIAMAKTAYGWMKKLFGFDKDGTANGAGGGGGFGSNAEQELEQIQRENEALLNAKKSMDKLKNAADGSKLITYNPKNKGNHHKSKEEQEVDRLLEKYKKVSIAYQELKNKAEMLKIAASTMFGNGKAIGEHKAELQNLEAEHEKVIEGYKEELKIAQRIPDSSKRDAIIAQINKQIAAENDLYNAKEKAENYKFAHRNDKSSSDIASSIIDKAFGTEDEMAKRKEMLKTALTELSDIIKNAEAGQLEGNVSDNLSEESVGFMAGLLKKTPDALKEELDSKKETIATFASDLRNSIAALEAEQQSGKNIGQQWADAQLGWIKQIGSSMGQAVSDWLTGTKSIGQAMSQMVRSLLSNAMQLLGEWLSIFAIMSIWNPPGAAAQAANKIVLGIGDTKGVKLGGKTLESATGGYITGDGTATSDSIPAMLSNGEYVIRAAAVDKLGVPFLDGLNSGKYTHRASGGLVGTTASFGSDAINDSARANSSGSSVTLNISAIDASGFSDFLARGGLNSIKQALTDDDRMFGSAAGVW